MEKRKYSKEFKREAVRLSYERENIKELALELGIDVQRIYKWRTLSRRNAINTTIQPTKNKEASTEVKELKRALKNAELELEILKKAVHIFSKRDGKYTNL